MRSQNRRYQYYLIFINSGRRKEKREEKGRKRRERKTGK